LGSVTGVFTPDPRNPIVFQKFTPRATLRYALGARSNIYASFSQGSKSGIVNYSDLSQPPVKQESVTAYEVGYKGVVGPGINLSLAAFHYIEKNLQVFAYQPPVYVYQNAASARINGVEAATSFNLPHGFSVDIGASYLDGKYTRFPAAAVFAPNAMGLGNDQITFDASGKRILRAPKFTGTMSLNYSTELESGKINAFASLYYNSGYYFDANNRIKQPRYTTLNAELSYEPKFLPGARLALYGSNLTNKTYYASILESQLGDNVYYADPRTWGVRVEFKF
jgi:iron complex outermembrane receptor protein